MKYCPHSFQSMIWSHVRTRESHPTVLEKAYSMAWVMLSSFPVSRVTGWRVRRGWSAWGAGGGSGAPLCQGVLVGGHMLSYFAFVTPLLTPIRTPRHPTSSHVAPHSLWNIHNCHAVTSNFPFQCNASLLLRPRFVFSLDGFPETFVLTLSKLYRAATLMRTTLCVNYWCSSLLIPGNHDKYGDLGLIPWWAKPALVFR